MRTIDHTTVLEAAQRFASEFGLPKHTLSPGDPSSQHWYDYARADVNRLPDDDGMELHVWRIRNNGTDIRLFKYVNGMDKGFTVCLRKGIPVEIRAKDHVRGSVEMDEFLKMLYGDIL